MVNVTILWASAIPSFQRAAPLSTVRVSFRERCLSAMTSTKVCNQRHLRSPVALFDHVKVARSKRNLKISLTRMAEANIYNESATAPAIFPLASAIDGSQLISTSLFLLSGCLPSPDLDCFWNARCCCCCCCYRCRQNFPLTVSSRQMYRKHATSDSEAACGVPYLAATEQMRSARESPRDTTKSAKTGLEARWRV